MGRPTADLESIALPKDAPATEPPADTPAARQVRAYAHTLSLRLTAEQFRRLRRFIAAHEEKTNQRLTHQGVIEDALMEWLKRREG